MHRTRPLFSFMQCARLWARRAAQLTLCSVVLTQLTAAQTCWTDHPVSLQTEFPFSVASEDIDGDGDLDIFSAAVVGAFTWKENAAGDGSVWIERPISSDTQMYFVSGGDIDGDGDMDAVTGGLSSTPVVWYENIEGDGSFWISHVISSAAMTFRSVSTGDIDGDGDLDVLAGSESDGLALWYENRGGSGELWAPHVIGTGGKILSIAGAHLNGDEFLDVVVADSGTNTLTCFLSENGTGLAWLPTLIHGEVNGAHSVAPADVDGDGDLDVMSASFADGTIAWHDNVNGDGLIWEEHMINAQGGKYISVAPADLDGDGDLDAVSAAFEAGNLPPFLTTPVAWHENLTGDGTAWLDHVVPATLGKGRQAVPADINGDGDMDIVSAISTSDLISWYENELSDPICAVSWRNLGGGTAGIFGVPALTGLGTPSAGSVASLSLTNAAPNAQVLFFIALDSIPLPAFGGTLFANPPVASVPLQTTPSGELLLTAVWPAGIPSATKIQFQYLISDAASSFGGVVLSNDLQATTL